MTMQQANIALMSKCRVEYKHSDGSVSQNYIISKISAINKNGEKAYQLELDELYDRHEHNLSIDRPKRVVLAGLEQVSV